MHLHVKDIPAPQLYHLLTQAVIPRPIAWVLTDNGTGEGHSRYNLAPFSFFNAMSANPPMVAFAISRKTDGSKKDTWVNLEQRTHCTIHIGSVAQIDALVDSSIELPHSVSELERLPYSVQDTAYATPVLAEAPIAFFCTLDHMHPLGEGETAVAFCKIDHIYISDAVVTQNAAGRLIINAENVDPLMRLGGRFYASLGEIIQHDRPTK